MKKFKKLLSGLAIVALSTSLLSACSSGNSKNSTDDKQSNPDEIVYSFVTFNKVPEDTSKVEKAINDITIPKINVKVKLKPMAISNYAQQVNLAIQSGEKLDIFHTLGDLNQYISKNMVMPLDDLLAKDGQETKQIVGEDFLKSTQSNGKTYAIPAYKGYALAPNLVYREDIMKELGVSPDSIKSIDDLDALFAKVKEKYPNMVPIAPANQGVSGVLNTMDNIDYLTDDIFKPTAVLVGDSTKVVSFYETEQFKEKIKIARDWFKKGYISKDAATSNVLATELMSSDRGFSYIASYAGLESGAQIAAMTGKPVNMVRLAQPYLSTTSVNAVSWAISANSEKPDAAMKFMNLTFSDKDIVNLIVFGLEGEDYTKIDADHVNFPEGKDANTVPYTAQLSSGIVGNMFNQFALEGQSIADMKLMESENSSSAKSKAFGFTFDSSSLKAEYSSVMNIINQYLPGLNTGSLDPDKELPNIIRALKEAGMDRIVAEKQKQLDAWLAQNNK